MKRAKKAKDSAKVDAAPDERLELFGVPCPMNAARALLALQLMDEGQVLEVWVDDGEPRENVPESLEMEGHQILGIACQDGRCRILVRVGG